MRNLELWKLEIGVAVRPDYNKMRGKVFQFLFRGYDACMGLQGGARRPMLGGVAGVAGGARRPMLGGAAGGARRPLLLYAYRSTHFQRDALN
jgi:hypothetical protein